MFWRKASPEVRCASVDLWCASYEQVPAGSLPDDDEVLTRICALDLDGWMQIRDAALAPWVKCSDGRLYHPVMIGVVDGVMRGQRVRTGGKIPPQRHKPDRLRPDLESPDWPALRRRVFERDDYLCKYCPFPRRGAQLECDHVVPVSRGGLTVMSNLITACRPCNRSKGNRLISEWKRR